jgi:hypothetical protein
MRFVAVILIWVVLVGGLTLFVNREREGVADVYVPPEQAAGVFWLDVTPTFSVTPDPFALQIDDNSPIALVIRLNNNEVLQVSEDLQKGRAIEVKPLDGLVVGDNEFFIKAQPATAEMAHANALRLRLFHGTELLMDETFWSEPMSPLVATHRVRVADPGDSREDDHDH